MSKHEVVIAEGVFSKLAITLNDDVANRLALIEPSNNPLAKVEKRLRKLLDEFERTYYKAVKK